MRGSTAPQLRTIAGLSDIMKGACLIDCDRVSKHLTARRKLAMVLQSHASTRA